MAARAWDPLLAKDARNGAPSGPNAVETDLVECDPVEWEVSPGLFAES